MDLLLLLHREAEGGGGVERFIEIERGGGHTERKRDAG